MHACLVQCAKSHYWLAFSTHASHSKTMESLAINDGRSAFGMLVRVLYVALRLENDSLKYDLMQ